MLNNKINSAPINVGPISRTADLKARQLLLRGSAQRESRQRDELLETNKNKKREEKHLTLRQRRLLLLENEDDSEKSNSKESGESEKEAQELANHTLSLTKKLKELAKGTQSIIRDDNKLLEDMDSKMDKNLANLISATHKVEEQLKSGGGVQWFMLFVVFVVWIMMVIVISTIPKLN